MVVPLCLFAADWMPYAFGMVCRGSPGRVDLLKLLSFVYLQLQNVIHYSGNKNYKEQFNYGSLFELLQGLLFFLLLTQFF